MRVLFSHTDCGPPGEPASTTGADSIVITRLSLIGLQSPLSVVSALRVTVPALISDKDGVYVALGSNLFGTKIPGGGCVYASPPLHSIVVETVVVAVKFTVKLLSHTVCGNPIEMVGASLKVTSM